jgi:hypothetical protein
MLARLLQSPGRADKMPTRHFCVTGHRAETSSSFAQGGMLWNTQRLSLGILLVQGGCARPVRVSGGSKLTEDGRPGRRYR